VSLASGTATTRQGGVVPFRHCIGARILALAFVAA
jgi:hypothetical protein